ncbi:hypothetical protein [Streptomyces wedmorensis]|uniref:hypothetical protein n=1 Tax=Streptomyces wedmorensis TaxID=43759 RepID=UPI0037A7C857
MRTTDPIGLRSALAHRGLALVPSEGGRWTVADIRAEELGAMAAREGIPLLELVDERASLEEAYLDLTAEHAPFAATH